MEYLSQSNFTPNISNYLGGIRAFFVIYNLSTSPFRDEKIQMSIRSLKINRPLVVKNATVFTDSMLLKILEVTSKLEPLWVFTALYLQAFFSFPKLSSIVPHSFSGCDVSRHLARGDMIFF